MKVEVVALTDGEFLYDGPMYAGLSGNMGPSAHIVQDGIHVLLVSQREQPFDTALARTLGLDPRQMRYICVKSSAHFRAGFESWAGAIHVVPFGELGQDSGVIFALKALSAVALVLLLLRSFVRTRLA